MSDIHKVGAETQILNLIEIQMRADLNNPVLARRMATFVLLSVALNLTAWTLNAGVLLFNLLATDMSWAIAVVIFCSVWLTIWVWTKFIMVPMGRRLSLQVHEEVLKVISGICDQAGQKKT